MLIIICVFTYYSPELLEWLELLETIVIYEFYDIIGVSGGGYYVVYYAYVNGVLQKGHFCLNEAIFIEHFIQAVF